MESFHFGRTKAPPHPPPFPHPHDTQRRTRSNPQVRFQKKKENGKKEKKKVSSPTQRLSSSPHALAPPTQSLCNGAWSSQPPSVFQTARQRKGAPFPHGLPEDAMAIFRYTQTASVRPTMTRHGCVRTSQPKALPLDASRCLLLCHVRNLLLSHASCNGGPYLRIHQNNG